jgi:HEPN domain-containing protein
MSVGTVAEWVREAEADYQNAQTIAGRRKSPTPKSVCWLCQQCAEKYLKAFLIHRSQKFPFRHDLIELANLCESIDADFRLIVNELEELNVYGPAFRYPGPSATAEDARSALKAIKRVREFTRAKLGLRK